MVGPNQELTRNANLIAEMKSNITFNCFTFPPPKNIANEREKRWGDIIGKTNYGQLICDRLGWFKNTAKMYNYHECCPATTEKMYNYQGTRAQKTRFDQDQAVLVFLSPHFEYFTVDEGYWWWGMICLWCFSLCYPLYLIGCAALCGETVRICYADICTQKKTGNYNPSVQMSSL